MYAARVRRRNNVTGRKRNGLRGKRVRQTQRDSCQDRYPETTRSGKKHQKESIVSLTVFSAVFDAGLAYDSSQNIPQPSRSYQNVRVDVNSFLALRSNWKSRNFAHLIRKGLKYWAARIRLTVRPSVLDSIGKTDFEKQAMQLERHQLAKHLRLFTLFHKLHVTLYAITLILCREIEHCLWLRVQ